MNEQITVMLVDDQQLVRGGLKMLINSQPDLQVVLEADDGAAAVDSYARMAEEGTAPQVVLMDVRMPIMDGLEAAKSILELNVPDSRVIMLTTFDVDEYVYAAVRAGASGFLLKDAPPEELLGAIRTIHRGDAVIA
ncbi:response regulator, partial [Rothia dentocariosa]